MTEVFQTMVVTAAFAPMARELASAVPAGLGMFVAGYSPTGKAPATHYVSEGWIKAEFAIALTDPATLVAVLKEADVKITLENAKSLLAQATVSVLPASEALNSMGLLPVSEEA